MRPTRQLTAAILCAAVIAMPAADAHGPKREDYVGHYDPLTFGQCRSATIPVNIGRVCFKVNPAVHNFVDIVGTDAVLGKAGLFYIFRDRGGNCVGESADPTAACPNADFLCGAIGNLSVPNAAVGLDIYTGGVLTAVACTGLQGTDTLGMTTTGTITAHFTKRAGDR